MGTIEYAYWASTLYSIPFVAHITDDIPIESNSSSKKALINAKSVLCSTIDHADYLSSVLHRTCNYLPPIGCSQPSKDESELKSRDEKKSFLWIANVGDSIYIEMQGNRHLEEEDVLELHDKSLAKLSHCEVTNLL